MNNNISVLLKRFAVPALLLLVGLTLVIIGLTSGQGMAFNVASGLMLMSAILSFLYSTGKVPASVVNWLGIFSGICAIGLLVLSYLSVKQSVEYQETAKLCRLKSETNLTDIRYIQKMYAERNGKYAADWATLIEYAKNGTVDYIDAVGSVPARKMTVEESKFVYNDNRPIDNNMTEMEAFILSKSPICPVDLQGFKRDTIQKSLMETKFKSASYIDNRTKNKLGKFYADSLPYIPFSNGKAMWKMETADSVNVDGGYYPAIFVEGILPYGGDTLRFGKITSNETGGNWE